MSRPSPRLFDYEVAELDDPVTPKDDGDTVRLWVWTTRYDKGWRDVRVLHIDTPDDTTPGPGVSPGVREAQWFTTLWLYGRRLRVTTRENDNFGRTLGDIYDADTGDHLDTALIRYCRDVLGIDITYART